MSTGRFKSDDEIFEELSDRLDVEQQENQRLREENERLRTENAELRQKVAEWLKNLEAALHSVEDDLVAEALRQVDQT